MPSVSLVSCDEVPPIDAQLLVVLRWLDSSLLILLMTTLAPLVHIFDIIELEVAALQP